MTIVGRRRACAGGMLESWARAATGAEMSASMPMAAEKRRLSI
jgi:hypothetical protein